MRALSLTEKHVGRDLPYWMLLPSAVEELRALRAETTDFLTPPLCHRTPANCIQRYCLTDHPSAIPAFATSPRCLATRTGSVLGKDAHTTTSVRETSDTIGKSITAPSGLPLPSSCVPFQAATKGLRSREASSVISKQDTAPPSLYNAHTIGASSPPRGATI